MATETTRIVAGLTPETVQVMQLGPGLLLANFEYQNIDRVADFYMAFEAAIREGKSLGATRGGIETNITPEKRQREIDGAIARFKGDSVIDSWECYFTCDLLEFSPKVLQAVFPTAEFAESSPDAEGRKITSMRIRTAIEDDDYMQNICWIATTDYGLIMFALHNALGQTTGSISAESANEGTIPFRADGFISSFDDIDYAPCEVWFIDRTGGISREVVATP